LPMSSYSRTLPKCMATLILVALATPVMLLVLP
jgi:hypothetical protein